jgi:hypothetical protein
MPGQGFALVKKDESLLPIFFAQQRECIKFHDAACQQVVTPTLGRYLFACSLRSVPVTDGVVAEMTKEDAKLAAASALQHAAVTLQEVHGQYISFVTSSPLLTNGI